MIKWYCCRAIQEAFTNCRSRRFFTSSWRGIGKSFQLAIIAPQTNLHWLRYCLCAKLTCLFTFTTPCKQYWTQPVTSEFCIATLCYLWRFVNNNNTGSIDESVSDKLHIYWKPWMRTSQQHTEMEHEKKTGTHHFVL